MLDLINQKIISELKKNGRISWGELAEIVGVSRQALKKRIERLEYKRHIIGYTIVTSHEPDPEISGVQAFLKIRFSKENDCFKLSRIISSYDNVVASWSVTGDWDNIILVRANSMEEISQIRESIVQTGGIDEIETDAVLKELCLTQAKET
ncbi:MAG: Lrp/AsnC family transcriptional regulator [Hyphomicrobiales bacterium]|nr:Lrp/AsnC family transcriptional regulator [Hyphomicrobiales bacterium]MCY4054148.1 Lrp/AsnC family transcriptional regulator [Hyphomicrobiales bacterium]